MGYNNSHHNEQLVEEKKEDESGADVHRRGSAAADANNNNNEVSPSSTSSSLRNGCKREEQSEAEVNSTRGNGCEQHGNGIGGSTEGGEQIAMQDSFEMQDDHDHEQPQQYLQQQAQGAAFSFSGAANPSQPQIEQQIGLQHLSLQQTNNNSALLDQTTEQLLAQAVVMAAQQHQQTHQHALQRGAALSQFNFAQQPLLHQHHHQQQHNGVVSAQQQALTNALTAQIQQHVLAQQAAVLGQSQALALQHQQQIVQHGAQQQIVPQPAVFGGSLLSGQNPSPTNAIVSNPSLVVAQPSPFADVSTPTVMVGNNTATNHPIATQQLSPTNLLAPSATIPSPTNLPTAATATLSPHLTIPHYIPPIPPSWGGATPALTVQDRPLVPPIYNGVNPNYPGLQLLHPNPPVFSVENFLTPAECDFLIHASNDALGPAPVVGKGAGEVSPSRTNSTCYLAREDLPEYLRKVGVLTGKPAEHCELPQVGRYLPSQQYLQHFDAFDLSNEDGRRFAANGGQRTITVLTYLNDVPRGGATSFPNLNIQVQPRRGMAVVFFPSTLDGLLDKMALHAAMPAVDVKYVSQVWIRQTNYEGRPSKRLAEPMVAGLQERREREETLLLEMSNMRVQQQQHQLQQQFEFQQHQRHQMTG